MAAVRGESSSVMSWARVRPSEEAIMTPVIAGMALRRALMASVSRSVSVIAPGPWLRFDDEHAGEGLDRRGQPGILEIAGQFPRGSDDHAMARIAPGQLAGLQRSAAHTGEG